MKTLLKLFLIQLCLPIMFAHSGEFFTSPEVKFSLTSDRVEDKFESVVLGPEGILKEFEPTGAQILNKKVVGTSISFTAVKTILGVSKKVFVQGVLSTERVNYGCRNNEKAYLARMDFSQSQDTLSNNIESLQMNICLEVKSSKNAMVRVISTLYKGHKYNSIVGKIAKEIIEAQIDPIIIAIRKVVTSIKM